MIINTIRRYYCVLEYIKSANTVACLEKSIEYKPYKITGRTDIKFESPLRFFLIASGKAKENGHIQFSPGIK